MARRRSADDEDSGRVRRALAGDGEALDELFRRYFPSAYNLAYRLAGNQDEAFELVQASFVRVQQTLPAIDLNGSFVTWLSRTVTHTFLDERQRRGERARRLRDGDC